MIWDTLAFNPDDMRYSCSGVACLQRYYQEEKKLCISRDSAKSALSDEKKNKLYLRKSGSRSSENDAYSIFEQAILSGIWLSRFKERCLFDF
ncbi:hypothetical protein ACFX10_014571 [Malus domestica]